MASDPPLIARLRVSGRVRSPDGRKLDVDALLHLSAYDESSRTRAISRILGRVGGVWLKAPEAEVTGWIPISLLADDELRISPALPAARAKVVVGFSRGEATWDALVRFEEELHENLVESGCGFVDGNDVDAQEFRLFVHGPRRAPLVAAVDAEIARSGLPGRRLR